MPDQDGFEYKLPGEEDAMFFPWAISDGAKDMLLIDRLTGMPVHEFFDLIEDNFDRGRAPILLAMVATSIRARFPDWSPERITRIVQNLRLSDVTFIDSDEEEAQSRPPENKTEQQKPDDSGKPSSESRSSATHPELSRSKTSVATPH